MTSGKSKRDRRLAEAKKRAALYTATPKTRYGQQPARSQAWANAQRKRQRRLIMQVVGGFSVVIVVLVIVIVIQHRSNNSNSATTGDTAPLDTTDASAATDTSAATASTAAPVPPPPLTAQVVAGATGALGVSATLNAYEITYDSTFDNAGATTTSTNDYLVQRPFNSSIKITSNNPESTQGSFTAISSLGSYSNVSSGTASAQANTPTSGLADFRFDVSLDDLVAEGTFVMKERRTLIGRQCQMYRTGQTPESYTVAAPTATDYVDLCIDDKGLILEEITVVKGSFQEHLVAKAVNEAPTPAADAFKALAAPTGLSDGGVSLVPLDATKAPVAGYWEFNALPAGYTLQGRYTYAQNIPDPSATTTTDPTAAPADPTAPTTAAKTITVPSYVDVYVNGPNYITVHQGPSSVVPSDNASSATATSSATLGSVKTAVGLTGTTMLITPTAPASWFVEVSATVSKDALAKIADTLKQTPQ